MLQMVFLGLPVGLAFGYTLQRGGFCMNSAFREVLFSRDGRLFKAWLIAVFIQMLLLASLGDAMGIVQRGAPVWWLAAAVGGLVFGLGMVLARGCTSGNYYRLGEGLIGAYVVVLVFLLGLLATDSGLLAPLRQWLRVPRLDIAPTFSEATGFSTWWVVVPLGALLAYWWWRGPAGNFFTGRWDWRETGVIVGLVAAIAWVASHLTGRDYGLSMIQPTLAWGKWLLQGDATLLNWSAFMLLALPFGAALGAKHAGQFEWRVPYPTRILQQMSGGLLMGIGASIAGGCNIGHSLTGVAVLSWTSILTTVFIALGCWLGVYVFFKRLQIKR